MNDKIKTLLNEQINKELYSAYLYVDIANYYDELDLDGYANYYMIQAQEERDHALLFMKYMQINNLKVTLEAIGKPDKVFSTMLDPLEVAAEHERYVTALKKAGYRGVFNMEINVERFPELPYRETITASLNALRRAVKA